MEKVSGLLVHSFSTSIKVSLAQRQAGWIVKSSSKNTRHEITACSYLNKNCAHRSDTAQSCEPMQIKQRYSTVPCPVTAIQTMQNHPKKHTLDSITLIENNDASS